MRKSELKRGNIVRAAQDLFHRQGYTATALADIAKEAKVPLGNVYYYFKTKEDLVAGVVEERNQAVRERHLGLEQGATTPLERLEAFLGRIHGEAAQRAAHGCPMGGLAQEAAKLGGRIGDEAASTFGLTLGWVGEQFKALGFKPAEAGEQAVDLVASVQGSILLGHSAHDPELIRRAVKRLQARVRILAKRGANHG